MRLLAQPAARLEPVFQVGFAGPFGKLRVVLPADQRRQRHQDRLDAAISLQTKSSSAVVDEVELDVAAAPEQLKLPLALTERIILPSFDDGKIGVQERLAAVLHEGKCIRKLVEEDA